jgi:hypothetical protein
MCGSVRYRDAETVPLSPNSVAKPLHNLHVEMSINNLSSLYEFEVHQTVDVKEFWELFDCSSFVHTYIYTFTHNSCNSVIVHYSLDNDSH